MAAALLALVLLAPWTTAAAQRTATRPAASTPRSAAYDIRYHLAIGDPASHRYHVELTVGGVTGDTLRLQMPVWSPGRYAKMDFAKNVLGLAVTDDNGRALQFDKELGSLWRVYPAGARAIHVRYDVFANTLSGTFSVLDSAHANFNGPSLFLYVVGHKPDPVRLTVDIPAGWHLINGASTQPDQREFTFPDYDHLIDTPTEVAPAFTVDSFRVDGRLYRVVVHHNGPEHGQRERFVRDVERIVRAENTVIAPPPLEMYTFLFNIGYDGRDGMEHLYSTQIMDRNVWSDTAQVLPGITSAAHEYFHTWNVKRIRPVALGPFDYTREQYQPSLWVAEGWTQYYGEMTLHRAGIISKDTLYALLGRRIQYNSELPARTEVSARMSSFNAPFWDGAAQAMATDRDHAFISYYYKGEALAMLLDLSIRGRTANARSLDDVLRTLKRHVWDDAPKATYYLQGRGYTEQDVERAASEVAGTDMQPWFERYVGGVEELPWTETLALAGLRVRVTGEGKEKRYVLEEIPDATDAQRRVRDGWLTDTTGTTASP
ncbi:MAG TPA: hypothetical protein VFK13_10090 [Gemmatimonadaceae bacterium]|nr:hypothetical protein [Gemmatimonadaceae bacterium]